MWAYQFAPAYHIYWEHLFPQIHSLTRNPLFQLILSWHAATQRCYCANDFTPRLLTSLPYAVFSEGDHLHDKDHTQFYSKASVINIYPTYLFPIRRSAITLSRRWIISTLHNTWKDILALVPLLLYSRPRNNLNQTYFRQIDPRPYNKHITNVSKKKITKKTTAVLCRWKRIFTQHKSKDEKIKGCLVKE